MAARERARVHLLIRGRVQGVGFRFAVCDEARSLGLSGWVRNLPDGGVEAVAEGDEKNLTRLVAWAYRGPRMARVDDVVEEWSDFSTGEFAGFDIR